MRLFIFITLACAASLAGATSIAEIATEEQIRSASCAQNAMPKSAGEKLLAATQTYLKSRDSIELMKAFKADEVPIFIARCFEIQATFTPKAKPSHRDSVHFYDGCERALRLLLIIEVARRSGSSTETVRKLNDQLYERILRFNQEHY